MVIIVVAIHSFTGDNDPKSDECNTFMLCLMITVAVLCRLYCSLSVCVLGHNDELCNIMQMCNRFVLISLH